MKNCTHLFFVCLHIMLSRTTLMCLWNIRVVYVVSTEFFAQAFHSLACSALEVLEVLSANAH